LIREAPVVHLVSVAPLNQENHVHDSNRAFANHYHLDEGMWDITGRLNISEAPGLTHLRNALLQDSSLRPAGDTAVAPSTWKWGLEFQSSLSGTVVVLFSPDCDVVLRHLPGRKNDRAEQIGAIADALRTVFDEWTKQRAAAETSAVSAESYR
jgi:hypothetical protein